MIPNTYLMSAPADAPDPVGRAIMFDTIVKGLQRINSKVSVWQQYPDGLWYPGKATGKTCLWIGEPGGKSQKISSITPGPVPEFTQISNRGQTLLKGWRHIFEACIRVKAATRTQIEQQFKVNLQIAGHDLFCNRCVMIGIRKPHNGGAMRYCNRHEAIQKTVDQMLMDRYEQNEMERMNVHV